MANYTNKYINWYKEADFTSLSPSEWLQLIDSLKFEDRLAVKHGMKTIRSLYYTGFWAYDINKNHLFRYNKENQHFEIVSYHNIAEDGEIEINLTGGQSRKLFTQEMTDGKWQKRYGCLYQNNQKFDESAPIPNYLLIQMIHDINRCVGPFIGNDFRDNLTIDKGLWKADVKSAYPFNSLDNLPDLHGAQLEYGHFQPTEEWPIVFYLESHNLAEFNGVDTRKDRNHYLYQFFRNLGRNKRYTKNGLYKDEAPITFLAPKSNEWCLRCKYAEKGLKNEMEIFYQRKENGDILAKQIINKVIGTLDYVVLDKETKSKVALLDYSIVDEDGNEEYIYYKKFGYYGHIRALILARHNHKMCQYYDEIKKKGYKFVCIQTDSIMWIGDGPIDSATKSKKMGALNLEIENGYGYIHACGIYYVSDNEKQIVKCQGLENFNKDNVYDITSFKNEINRKRLKEKEFDVDTLTWKIIKEDIVYA